MKPQPDCNSKVANDATGDVDLESIKITDPDLLSQLDKLTQNRSNSRTKLVNLQINRLKRKQYEMNLENERQNSMTTIQKRRARASQHVSSSSIDPRKEIYHIHSVLALCTLPYRKPKEEFVDYQAEYGNMSLNIQPGRMRNPLTGEWEKQGIPYGSKARLLLLHICTRALQQKSPEVEIEDSMSAFIKSLGFSVTGGQKGTINLFKEQLNRLASCRFQISLWDKERSTTRNFNVHPIEDFEVWFPKDPDQPTLWTSKVVLSQKFYESLTEHALPADIRVLSALNHSPRQMDIFLWLSYRLKPLSKNYQLTWGLLKDQFCQSQKTSLSDFKRDFRKDIAEVQEVIGDNNLFHLNEKGMLLKPSASPDYLFVPPKLLSDKSKAKKEKKASH